MSNLRSNACRNRNLLLIAIVLSLNACGSSESEEIATQTATVDPRFATAEAILDYYNQIAMQKPRADVVTSLSLLYPENPKQEQIVRIFKNSLPLMELDALCWEKFGVGIMADSKESPFTPARNPALMSEFGEERSKARLKENDGRETDVYLVKYNGRWWISGYTLEYDKKIIPDGTDLTQAERTIGNFASAAPVITNKINSGEITSIESAVLAFQTELDSRSP